MKVSAIIMAAGSTSETSDFIPLRNMGAISIAQRIVTTLHQSGISRIVVITGYNAEKLEHHLSREGVIFLRNEAYETTEMFDSLKIGLRYLQGKCDAVLVTPADIPLFTARTVAALLTAASEAACPVCDGHLGHPILLGANLIEQILSDSGQNGLHGAVARCNVPITYVDVTDPGISYEATTENDSSSLLNEHNTQLNRPDIQIALSREKPFLDRKIAMLLTLVDETSSVLTACQRMQLSYSSGWALINTAEAQLGYLLIERHQGGAKGGNSSLTPAGIKLLHLYEQFESDLRHAANDLFCHYFSGILNQ